MILSRGQKMESKIIEWFNDNYDWIDSTWQDYYFSRGGQGDGYDNIPDWFIEELYDKEHP